MSVSMPETDKNGYLKNWKEWNEEIARSIADREGLTLSEDHWSVIGYVREFYELYEQSPAIRPLVKFLKQRWGEEKGNSIYLATLFPGGVAKQATKLAGLPKPKRCI